MGIVEILLIILSLLCVVVVPGLLIATIYMLRGDRKYDNGGLGEKVQDVTVHASNSFEMLVY